MPSVVRERMQKLMDEQKAEAVLPTSRAVMDFGEDEVEDPQIDETQQSGDVEEMPLPEVNEQQPDEQEQPEQEEPTQQQEEMPLPDESPDVEMPAADDSAEVGDETSEVLDEQDEQPAEDKPDPGWEELLMDMGETDEVDGTIDPFADAMSDVDWRMTLQNRSQSLL